MEEETGKVGGCGGRKRRTGKETHILVNGEDLVGLLGKLQLMGHYYNQFACLHQATNTPVPGNGTFSPPLIYLDHPSFQLQMGLKCP